MLYSIGSRSARTTLMGAAVLVFSVVMPRAWAGDGIQTDVTVLRFSYQVINPNAQEGEVIGRISVTDDLLSVLDALKIDLGGDGMFGGGDDTILDIAEIDDAGQFSVFFGGDVIKLAGPNNYELLGVISIVDFASRESIRGRLTTSYISLGGRVFSIIGTVGPDGGEDSLLLPGPGNSWVFTGSPADTNGTPDEDGTVGTITVPTGRSLYTAGNILEFHFAFDGNVNLDAYFKQNRSASSSDIKLLIPRGDEPPVLGACCLPDGSCAGITRDECAAAGGAYKGDNVPCDNHTCAETGACCLPDGSCAEMYEDECDARGGEYHGDNTVCTDDLCVTDCNITCPPDVRACASCGQCTVSGVDLGRPTLDGDCQGASITNDAPSAFPIGTTIVTWTVTVGNRTSTCTQKVTVDGTICGMKWYDKDLDGVKDSNEEGINGWRIELRDEAGNLVKKVYTRTISYKKGRYEFPCVAPGTYTVLEVMPNGDWVPTTPTSYTVTVGDGNCDLKRNFGNVCLGGDGGHTPGYWGNSNGECKMKDGGSANPELAMLRGLNLRKADGHHFDPTTYDQFKTWLRNGRATNMAYMLSIHLAAMALNVEAGYVSNHDVVYAPGIGNRGPGNNFITIGDLIAAADRVPVNGLGADGYTPSGDPNRAIQELRKNALDAANNNENFVNGEPCCFRTPY